MRVGNGHGQTIQDKRFSSSSHARNHVETLGCSNSSNGTRRSKDSLGATSLTFFQHVNLGNFITTNGRVLSRNLLGGTHNCTFENVDNVSSANVDSHARGGSEDVTHIEQDTSLGVQVLSTVVDVNLSLDVRVSPGGD